MDANEAGIPKREVNQSSGLPCSSRPRQRGALTPPSQEHCHWQWTREQPPKPRQRGALPPSWNDQPPKLSPSFIPRQPPRPLQADVTREQSHRPWQRGVIQEQPNDVQTRLHHRSAVSPSVHEHLHATHDGPFVSGRSSPHMQGPTQKAVQPQECMLALPLHHIKSAFMDAWASLDDTLERNQSMFSEMQKEMETSRSETRALKEAALNEKEELEASKTEILRDLESASQQGARIENISQRVEHICTDLSVQLAELNHLQGQIDEEQAALLTTLINDPCKVGKTSENLEMDLESHEERISLLEKELSSSRLASERLEQAGLKGISELNEVLDGMPQSISELPGSLNASSATCPPYGKAHNFQSKETSTGIELGLPHDGRVLQVNTVQKKETSKCTTLSHQDSSETSQKLLGTELQSTFGEEDAHATFFLQAKANFRNESSNMAAIGERPHLKRSSDDVVYEDMSAFPGFSRNGKVPKV